jgi:DNA-binding MltR family transcriptional regulator
VSNREALRKLSRRFPPPPEIKNILDALSKEEDRTAAIVGASILESALERLMIKCFIHSDSDLLGQLFQNRGPLSDFHSKIIVATAFGVISPNTAEELHTIKAIRNVFAHSRVPVSFATREVEREVKAFLMLVAMKNVEADQARKLHLPTKSEFTLIVKILFIILDHQHRKLGGPPLALD